MFRDHNFLTHKTQSVFQSPSAGLSEVPGDVNAAITQGWDKLHRLSQSTGQDQDILSTNRSCKNRCRQPLQSTHYKVVRIAGEIPECPRGGCSSDIQGAFTQWQQRPVRYCNSHSPSEGKESFWYKMGCLPVLVSGLLDAKSKRGFAVTMFVSKEMNDTKVQNKTSLYFWNNA